MKETEEILEELLNNRGLHTAEEIGEFLSDRPRKTYDPFLLLNMEAGVDLLLSVINSGGSVCVYGDYDADGVTSVCVLSHVIGMLTDDLTYYIPSRVDEGYGLNKEAIRRIKGQGTDLIVTVDCGSVSYDEVEYAKELGMDIIVTDHHSIDSVKADCLLINPKQDGCTYPFKGLAGCGVAFKMAQAIRDKAGLPRNVVNDVLDLVAVGTVGDIVPLTDENRTIVKYGLYKINEGKRKALRELAKAISLTEVTSESIAFGIAPHINAAGRMADAKTAVELFMADESDDAAIESRIEALKSFNAERKSKQNDAYEKALSMLTGDERFIVLRMDDIHEGIAGIAAGKIKEELNVPVIIVTPSGDGRLKGTGRSVDGVDIYGLLSGHKELFERFGGHSSACGFLMGEEKLDELKRSLAEDMERLLDDDPGLLTRKAEWEVDIESGDVTIELAKALDRLEPCGQENPKPVFRIGHALTANVRFMGESGEHARFDAVSDGCRPAECVYFRKAADDKDLITGNGYKDIIGTVNLQTWRERERVQFIVEEILPCRE